MTVTLAADARNAAIHLDLPQATADDVEVLIHELATLRQEMLPEVPRHRPQHMLMINEPDVKMKIGKDGLIAFVIRSSGLGWLDIPFTRKDSALTVVACAGAAREMETDAQIFREPEGHA